MFAYNGAQQTPQGRQQSATPPPAPAYASVSPSRVNYFAKISTTTKFDKNLMCAPRKTEMKNRNFLRSDNRRLYIYIYIYISRLILCYVCVRVCVCVCLYFYKFVTIKTDAVLRRLNE